MPSPPGLGPGRLSRAVEFLESPDRVGVIFQTKVIFTLRGGGRQVMFRVSALEWGERAGVGEGLSRDPCLTSWPAFSLPTWDDTTGNWRPTEQTHSVDPQAL